MIVDKNKDKHQRIGVKYQFGKSSFDKGVSNSVRVFYEKSSGGFNPKSPEIEFLEFYNLIQWSIEENLFSDSQKLALLKKLLQP